MNIWLINQYAGPPGEPGGTRHFSLACRLVSRGHRVTVVASNVHYATGQVTRPLGAATSRFEELDGVGFVWLQTPAYRGNGVGRLLNMAAFAARVRWGPWRDLAGHPDVILGSSPQPFAALAAERLARELGVPFVYEIRDLWPESLVQLAGISRWHPLVVLIRAVERHLVRVAATVVSVLPGVPAYARERGLKLKQFAWIPNGVDRLPSLLEPAASTPRPFIVLYAGSHGLANGLGLLLDAAPLVRAAAPDLEIVFRLVGDGPEKPGLEARASAEGLSNIRFQPWVPKAQMPSVLAGADAFVLIMRASPLYRWGISPNKLFDYLGAGRPVVFAGDPLNNLVAESAAGIAVPPGDASALANAIVSVARLAPEDRARMGERGRALVAAQYTHEALSSRLEAVFESVVAQRDRPVGSVRPVDAGGPA